MGIGPHPHSSFVCLLLKKMGLTENARPENDEPSKSRDVKMQDMKMHDPQLFVLHKITTSIYWVVAVYTASQ